MSHKHKEISVNLEYGSYITIRHVHYDFAPESQLKTYDGYELECHVATEDGNNKATVILEIPSIDAAVIAQFLTRHLNNKNIKLGDIK